MQFEENQITHKDTQLECVIITQWAKCRGVFLIECRINKNVLLQTVFFGDFAHWVLLITIILSTVCPAWSYFNDSCKTDYIKLEPISVYEGDYSVVISAFLVNNLLKW